MEGTVKEKQPVKKGDVLLILESMKMEFSIISQFNGIVERIYINPGEQVNSGQLAACIKVK
jgi:urea carboxylase